MKVYLDYHSTTKCDDRVVQEMLPYFTSVYGNPSAIHSYGDLAKDAVLSAKEKIAKSIKCNADDIYLCSGATEANNIALKGRWLNYRKRYSDKNKRAAIITSPVEHGSIIKCVEQIKKYDKNIDIVFTKINKDGTLNLDYLDNLINIYEDFILAVSIMTANNEIGTIYDISSISKICERYRLFFHTDATQALGKVDINIRNLYLGAASFSAHKIYGPKGVGALYIKNEFVKYIDPLLDGGYQSTITSGTQNVPAIVGFGKACELLENQEEVKKVIKLRNYLAKRLTEEIDKVTINGTMLNRLPNNLNINIDKVKAETLILGLGDVIVSSGAACKSGDHKPSHVLEAIGSQNPEYAIRFGLGRWTTKEEIDYTVERIKQVVKSIRNKD